MNVVLLAYLAVLPFTPGNGVLRIAILAVVAVVLVTTWFLRRRRK
jgi:hypothetical protein